MGYKPRTSSEINQFHIERTLKKLKRKEIKVQDANLNKRFDRLKVDNIGMWEELYPKYISVVKEISTLTYY